MPSRRKFVVFVKNLKCLTKYNGKRVNIYIDEEILAFPICLRIRFQYFFYSTKTMFWARLQFFCSRYYVSYRFYIRLIHYQIDRLWDIILSQPTLWHNGTKSIVKYILLGTTWYLRKTNRKMLTNGISNKTLYIIK